MASHLVLLSSDPQQPRLILNPLRRVALGGSALLLAIAAGVGWTAMPATHSEYPLGTIIYLAVLLLCTLAAAYSRTIRFRLAAGCYEQREALFGLTLRRLSGDIGNIGGIRVVALQMIPERAKPASGVLNAGYRGAFARRRRYYRLELQENGQWRLLDDSRNSWQLQGTGKRLADLLGCSYSFEQR